MPDDDHLAADLAAEAGRRLLALRASGGDPGDLRREGDRSSHEFLAAELARQRPGDALLSEEGADSRERLSASRVWIVDPLDGTREFGEPGRTDWAVHVALWERGSVRSRRASSGIRGSVWSRRASSGIEGELTAGAVALPAQGRTLSTADPPPSPAGRPGQGVMRLVVSRTRPPGFMARLAGKTGAELIPLGSAGAKAAAVISGDAEAYVHSGGQYEWDSAAPVAVALAAGLHASRIDGSKLRYNQDPPSLPDILICQAALAGTLLEAIGAVTRE
jgi:3'(2'), 5'-bisphosphate nucleotidase